MILTKAMDGSEEFVCWVSLIFIYILLVEKHIIMQIVTGCFWFFLIELLNISTFQLVDSRNASCALNCVSTFSLVQLGRCKWSYHRSGICVYNITIYLQFDCPSKWQKNIQLGSNMLKLHCSAIARKQT